MKQCSRCGNSYTLDEFTKNGRGSYCRTCRKEYLKEYRLRNKEALAEKNRANTRRYRYGISQEQYENMLEAQGHRCAVCKVPFSDVVKPKIDHDHNCCPGKVTCGKCTRGILCSACIAFAGLIETRFDTCVSMFEYLRLHIEFRSLTDPVNDTTNSETMEV